MKEKYMSDSKGFVAQCSCGAVYVAVMLCMLLCALSAHSFTLDTYAADSKLASGRWVKVSVETTGMHNISDATLRSWGFSNPAAVKVYGYGGNRLPDQLLQATFNDDLPQAPSEYVDGKGLYFYALGPVEWKQSAAGYYRPSLNPFSFVGYYFLSDSDSSPRLEVERRSFTTLSPEVKHLPSETIECDGEQHVFQAETIVTPVPQLTKYFDRRYHKTETVSPGEAGFMLLGEDFRYNQSQQFAFDLPQIAEPDVEWEYEYDCTGRRKIDSTLVTLPNLRIEFDFVAKTLSAGSGLRFSLNGEKFPRLASDSIGVSEGSYVHGRELLSRKTAVNTLERITLGVDYGTRGSMVLANLNYIAVNYQRRMELPSERHMLIFLDRRGQARLAGATSETRVWDVSDPGNIRDAGVKLDGTVAEWCVSTEVRDFAAWEPGGTYPCPKMVEVVKAQNLHALPVPDMVIITPAEWKSEAERLADFHRTDAVEPLQVLVQTPEEVYNEFSSGNPDVHAFRKMFKMFYDRSGGKYPQNTAPEGQGKLRYVLLMCRPTFDYRKVTSQIASMNVPTVPAWFTESGLNDNSCYTTDDFMAFLEDNSGVNTGRDRLSVALGRLPVTSVSDAKAAVDKILAYSRKSPEGLWRNNVVILADDKDKGVHMTQANQLWSNMCRSHEPTPGSGGIYKKVYIDEYDLVSNSYPEARNQLYRALDEGALLWTFIGHANPASLTAEKVVTYTDLNNLYLRHWPVIYAATCDFLRWDSATTSGAEILFKNPSGGVIAAISAVRPVYIGNNGTLSASLGAQFFRRNAQGRQYTIGEIYQRTKILFNNIDGDALTVTTSDTNKLRYVLLGDPAMRLLYPENIVHLTEAGDMPVVPVNGAEEPAQLMARQNTTIKGKVTSPDGTLLEDFNGTVTATLYDADQSVTTHGWSSGDDAGIEYTFDKMGGRLFVGTARVQSGVFEMAVSMPAEVADNYRQATVNLYAVTDDGQQANGVCRDIYVYGTDDAASPDTTPPVIESIYLNHSSFKEWQSVNPSPMLIATVSDDRAINLSTAGVGHQMTLYLDDGATSYTDVSDFFTPFSDGRAGGTIRYPLTDLAVGPHSLRLRVWDTAPNSAESTICFNVANDVAPVIYDVYTDRNPVSDRANFYVSHDRPDQTLTVTVEVFDLMGKPLWSESQTGRSDMFTTIPLTWDLTDNGGRRVSRGIYLYRATIKDEGSGEQTATASRKLAVTAQ